VATLLSGPRPRRTGTPKQSHAPNPFEHRARAIGLASALAGSAILVLAILSALFPQPPFYPTALAGYDPPFDAVAGVLLIALAFRLAQRSLVAWLFSLLAPALTISIALASPNPFSIGAAGIATAFVLLIYPYRSGFFRGADTGPETTQLLVLVAALITLLFGMVGSRWLASQFTPPVAGWADALYFTVATISTNGTNFIPLSNEARVFVVLLILLGVGTFLSALALLFFPLLERRLEAIASRVERAQMEELAEHVIICGTSAESRATAENLRDRGIRSVIIARDEKEADALRSDGYRVHLGEPSSEDDLRAVGIERARALVVAQESDAESLLTVITARGIMPSLRIVAVAAAANAATKLRKAGANETISVVKVAAGLLTDAAVNAPPAVRSAPATG